MDSMKRCAVALWLIIAIAPAVGDMQRGEQLVRGNKYREAAEHYREILPTLGGAELQRAKYRLGFCTIHSGRHREAIPILTEVAASEDADAETRARAHLYVGYALKLDKKHEEAIAACERAMAVPGVPDGVSIDAALYAGWSLRSLGRTDESIAMLRRGAAFEGAHPVSRASALISIGDIERMRKNYEAARVEYERVVAMENTGHRRVKAQTKLVELETLTAGDMPFYIDPFVTHVTPTGAMVSWSAKGPADGACVEVNGETTDATPYPIAEDGLFQMVRVELTGLTPDTKYEYTARCGDQARTGSFRTAPVESRPINFVVIGDTQTNARVHEKLAPLIAAHNPEFLVNCGDLVERGADWFQWQSQFFAPGSAYMSKTPIYVTRGNHDGGPYFPQMFELRKAQHYSFDWGDLHVVVLDAFGPGASRRSGRPKQVKWLENDLANNKKKWTIVAIHDPMVNSDNYNDWYGTEDLLPVLERHGVDFVLSGHHHLYRRYLPIRGEGDKPIIHVTTGGAGGSLGGAFPSTIMARGAEVHHYLTFRIDGDTLEMIARDIDDQEIDRLKLVKRDGAYQDEVTDLTVERADAFAVSNFYFRLIAPRTDRDVPARVAERSPATVHIDLTDLPTGAFDPATLPSGTKLIVRGVEGCAWTVEEQTCDPTTGAIAFEATAPEGKAPLMVEFQMLLGERELIADRFRIVEKAE